MFTRQLGDQHIIVSSGENKHISHTHTFIYLYTSPETSFIPDFSLAYTWEIMVSWLVNQPATKACEHILGETIGHSHFIFGYIVVYGETSR